MREIDNPDNPTQTASASYTWYDALTALAKKPEVTTAQQILADTSLTPQRAYLWVLVGGVLMGVALASNNPFNIIVLNMLIGIPFLAIDTSLYQPDVLTIVLNGVIFGAIYGVIGFIIQTWLVRRIAGMLGAQSTYRDVYVLRGLYYPIMLAIRGLVFVIVGVNSAVGNTLLFVTLFADILLTATVLSVSSQLTWGRSMLAVGAMNGAMLIGLMVLTSMLAGFG